MTLKEIVSGGKRIVFFGGAGVSTESGIPDFRSKDGLYRTRYEVSPETVLCVGYFQAHTAEFYRFYRDKMLPLAAQPNLVHRKLGCMNCTAVFTATPVCVAAKSFPPKRSFARKECRTAIAAA